MCVSVFIVYVREGLVDPDAINGMLAGTFILLYSLLGFLVYVYVCIYI